MWLYVQSLGGSHYEYGMAITAFSLCRILTMGAFGMWVDTRTYKEVYVTSLLIAMFGGLIYAAAPTFGLWCLILGRGIMGAMSSCECRMARCSSVVPTALIHHGPQLLRCATASITHAWLSLPHTTGSVATQAFVATNTSLADRTKYMAINTFLGNVCTLAGPVFNLFIVLLPVFDVHIGSKTWVFNSYTWVGYFLFTGQWIVLTFILCCFNEPARKQRRQAAPLAPCGNETVGKVATIGGLFPYARIFLDSWLHKTGCWMVFLANFRNNYQGFGVSYAIPLITDRDYGWGQLNNSYVFLARTIAGLLSVTCVGWIAKHPWGEDRRVIIVFTSIGEFAVSTQSIPSQLDFQEHF